MEELIFVIFFMAVSFWVYTTSAFKKHKPKRFVGSTEQTIEALVNSLIEQGFVEITKEHPIGLLEMYHSFDNLYYLVKRFKREKAGVVTIITIGGNSYYTIYYVLDVHYKTHSCHISGETHKNDIKTVNKYIRNCEEIIKEEHAISEELKKKYSVKTGERGYFI